jgi:tetratricopeptide (TPR) repeat protein
MTRSTFALAFLTLIICVAPCDGSAHAQSATAPQPFRVRGLLDAYLAGDFDLATVPHLRDAPLPPADTLRSVLSKEGTLFVSAGLPAQRDRRRLIVATVALQLANRIGFADWRRAAALFEWGCGLVRENSAPSDAERLWHWAGVALTQASGDGAAAALHAGHASRRFPDEPRFVLARAIALELQSWPDDRHRSPRDRNARLADQIVERFMTAARHPETQAEARLRLGFLFLRQKHAGNALRQFREAGVTADAYLQHLLALFEGRALEREDRMPDAIAAYRRALAAAPGAQTAQLALASALARSGSTAEAVEVMGAAVTGDARAVDPWLLYGQADLRFWPAIMIALREQLR